VAEAVAHVEVSFTCHWFYTTARWAHWPLSAWHDYQYWSISASKPDCLPQPMWRTPYLGANLGRIQN